MEGDFMPEVSDSILQSTKLHLGIDPSYDAFDLDVIVSINTVFAVLEQLGVGPVGGFSISDGTAVWTDYLTSSDPRLEPVKTYMWLKTKSIFDPSTSSTVNEANNNILQELEFRLGITADPWGGMIPNTVRQ